ncbi:hypothetical protein BRADI_5g11443v3 [Brachypodium distachyon]|uniref:Factor of DNA methylation 1-5/IDN2 domain-containing protein n=1 Tax=Brachypodium distachyon TaxID=15368 RepID=A0A2K2CGM4_BRADI|nr:hypothetical protein BRADI_5g11443v3 [Brachypodium distachyon]
MWNQKRQSEGHCEEADEDIEDTRKEICDIHSKLIKGFIDINSTGGRNIAIKYIGELNYKPFLSACLEKLPPKKAKEKASELYYFWKEQLLNPQWNPLKTVTVGGIPEEIIDMHDDKLQELHAAGVKRCIRLW